MSNEERLSSLESKLDLLISNLREFSPYNNQSPTPGMSEWREGTQMQKYSEDINKSFKVDFPDFHGSLNPEDLFEWLRTT